MNRRTFKIQNNYKSPTVHFSSIPNYGWITFKIILSCFNQIWLLILAIVLVVGQTVGVQTLTYNVNSLTITVILWQLTNVVKVIISLTVLSNFLMKKNIDFHTSFYSIFVYSMSIYYNFLNIICKHFHCSWTCLLHSTRNAIQKQTVTSIK